MRDYWDWRAGVRPVSWHVSRNRRRDFVRFPRDLRRNDEALRSFLVTHVRQSPVPFTVGSVVWIDTPWQLGCKGPIAKETFVMTQGVVVASVLVLGGLLVGGQPAAAAPALPADQAFGGEVIVQQIQYRYCRGWHRECSSRWGYGWLYRRCMRRHGC